MGKTVGFEAVPGCGLICQVTNADALVDSGSPQVDIMNMRNAGDEYTVTIDAVTLTESSSKTPSISEFSGFHVYLFYNYRQVERKI